MVIVSHLFLFMKKFEEGVTRYEAHPPSLRTVCLPIAHFRILYKKIQKAYKHLWKLTTAIKEKSESVDKIAVEKVENDWNMVRNKISNQK